MSDSAIQKIGLAEIEFVDNPENRCPVVLLLDTSASMKGAPITELNNGINRFRSSLLEDELASLRVEIALVTFGDSVSVVQDFATADSFDPPVLQPKGFTLMGQAIEKGMDILESRKQLYKNSGILYYRPWILLITDGAPTDAWEAAARRVQAAENDSKLLFFAIGVKDANMKILKKIAPPTRAPMKLTELKFEELFLWLSASLQQVSSGKIGDFKALPPASGWGEVPT